jgi:hypothetical protein
VPEKFEESSARLGLAGKVHDGEESEDFSVSSDIEEDMRFTSYDLDGALEAFPRHFQG